MRHRRGARGRQVNVFGVRLQLRVAGAEEELILGGQQAIPLLLRVRQLDPKNLPKGPTLIEKATASKDRAALMPDGWVHRQMRAGRVLFMLDGLDEVEPELRDRCVLPWLVDVCKKHPKCAYLVSSRPVGYPPGTLDVLGFAECDLLDFGDEQIAAYTRHWCTAVRLAQNEPREEARREGKKDGYTIVQSFEGHPYISNLARNPLMLSAICLVNYFEGGRLPEDRSKLYQLCTEGLLHHWDQRRGIHSEFAFDEKLRVCRELALAMQAEDRAECEATGVEVLFSKVLGDSVKAGELVEHIRYRTGLLVERRPGVFAFAHLTFQEYLAARAVHEGNHQSIDPERLVQEHNDGRWHEVIALFCGLTPAPAAQKMIESLIEGPNTEALAIVLAEAYFSAKPELSRGSELRKRVIERIALSPHTSPANQLERFEEAEIKETVNSSIARIRGDLATSEAYKLLLRKPDLVDIPILAKRLKGFRDMTPVQLAESVHLLHYYGSNSVLLTMASHRIVFSPGPRIQRN